MRGRPGRSPVTGLAYPMWVPYRSYVVMYSWRLYCPRGPCIERARDSETRGGRWGVGGESCVRKTTCRTGGPMRGPVAETVPPRL